MILFICFVFATLFLRKWNNLLFLVCCRNAQHDRWCRSSAWFPFDLQEFSGLQAGMHLFSTAIHCLLTGYKVYRQIVPRGILQPTCFRSPQHGITTKNIQAWETRLPALKWSWNKMILNNAKMQCILAFVTLAYTSCNFMILQNITRRKRLSDRLAMSFLAPLRVHGVSTVEHVDKRGWVEKSGVDKGLAILWGSKSLPLSSAPKPWREAWVYIISIKIYQVRNPWISTLKLRLCPRRVEGLLPGKGHVEDTQCSSCLFGDGIWKITWYT